MATETMVYPADGTLDDISRTCTGDEAGFRGRLIDLAAIDGADDARGNEAIYRVIPVSQPYPKKKLFFFDITGFSLQKELDLVQGQMQQTRAQILRTEVYINNELATILVFREQ